MSLETDDIVQRCAAIILTQLYDRIGQLSCTGDFKAYRLHGAKPQCIDTTGRHDFYRHAAFKDGIIFFKIVEFGTFCRRQGLPERFVFFFRKRAVQIIGSAFAIAGSPVYFSHIQRFHSYNRRRGIVEMEIFFSCHLADSLRHGRTGQRSRGDDTDLVRRELRDFFVPDRHQRMMLQMVRNILTEGDAVHGQGSPGRHAVRIGRRHDERSQTAHFFLQETNGIFDIGSPQ